VDADQLAREVVEPGTPALEELVSHFGPTIVRDGQLDRAALASIVFADPAALATVEAITHPRIRARFDQIISALPAGSIVIHEVPLLAEKSLGDQYHVVLGVEVEPQTRRHRLRERGMSEQEIDRRMAAQVSDAERARHCDLLVDNNGDLGRLEEQVTSAWNRISAFADNMNRGEPAHHGLLPKVDTEQVERVVRRLRHRFAELELVETVISGERIVLKVRADEADDQALLAAGYAPTGGATTSSRERGYRSCDPGVPIVLELALP